MAGVRAALNALKRLLGLSTAAATPAARAMADVLAREVRLQLTLSSHGFGTPTPSSPGQPPSRISGTLANSFRIEEVGPGVIRAGSTAPYARVQELGGFVGRGHLTELPARPYLRPAWEKARLEARQAAVQLISEVIRRG